MKFRFTAILLLLLFFSSVNAQIAHGTAISFDGDDWVDIGDRSALEFGIEDFTISTWFKTTVADRQQIIIRKGLDNRTQNDGRWILGIHTSNVLRVTIDHVDNTIGSTFSAFGSTNVTDGNWHHVAAVLDRDEALYLYLDGNLELVDTSLVSQSGAISNPASVDVYLGRGNSGNVANFFFGSLDEMRIWNKTRTQGEIVATMSDTIGPEYYASTDSGLIAYWRFDEGEGGEIISDISTGDNNGLVIGPEFTTITVIEDIPASAAPPSGYKLAQNYPNPFNPVTQIDYRLEERGLVNLIVYNVLGQRIKVLVDEELPAGAHSAFWNATDQFNKKVSSGNYYYVMKVNNTIVSRKMVVLK